MHIVLVGPGALGSLLACQLGAHAEKGVHRVTVLDHNHTRADQLHHHGITCITKEEQFHVQLPTSSDVASVSTPDIVILCVKSYDVVTTLQYCAPLLLKDTLLIFMQNGIAHLQNIAEHTGEATAVYGTTTEGATLIGPGQVRHAGRGVTQFGFVESVPKDVIEKLNTLVTFFTEAGFTARISQDIRARLWTKLLINIGINGLTAIHNCPNGALLTRPGVRQRMVQLIEEAKRVAGAAQIDVPENIVELTCEVCRKTSENISSMLQDVRSGRRTEIDAINGALVHLAAQYGIAAPENTKLVAQVQAIQQV